MKVIRKFITCSCESEAILLEKYKGEDEVYLSLFGRGLNIKRYNIKDRKKNTFKRGIINQVQSKDAIFLPHLKIS